MKAVEKKITVYTETFTWGDVKRLIQKEMAKRIPDYTSSCDEAEHIEEACEKAEFLHMCYCNEQYPIFPDSFLYLTVTVNVPEFEREED